MAIRLNWPRILTGAGIEYVERGPNVKKGEVNIKCPFCGSADPSHHLGLNDDGRWACWRNDNHRGKSPVRLLVRLLNISYIRAREICGLTNDYVDPDGFTALADKILRPDNNKLAEKAIVIPEGIRDIAPTGATKRFFEYLHKVRGFYEEDVIDLSWQYQLGAGVSGYFKDRLVLPYLVAGLPVTFTGRAIGNSLLRYKDLPLADSVLGPKETLYNLDCISTGGDALVIVEGGFDVLKLDFYGMDWGVRSVGLSTNSMTDQQIYIIEEASRIFKKVYMMMDNATSMGVVDSFRMRNHLSHIRNLETIPVPFGAKDTGALPPSLITSFCRGLV